MPHFIIARNLVALGWTNDIAAQTDVWCTDVWACNFNPEATEDDGSCDYQSCIGCTNQYACNFDPGAIYNDGSCEYLSCVGCMAPDACNFDPEALIPNSASCDFESCVGCTDFTACTFDPEATLSDPTQCVYPIPDYDCEGNLTGWRMRTAFNRLAGDPMDASMTLFRSRSIRCNWMREEPSKCELL